MGLIDIAAEKSVWQGIEYFNMGKVISRHCNEDGTIDGNVAGNGGKTYTVHADPVHPRKSKCNCPLADGRQVICKHIIAVSLCGDPSEAERFKRDLTPYASMEEAFREKRRQTFLRMAGMMSKGELREAYVEAMLEIDDLQKKLQEKNK